jgi:hypothetical protein
VIPGGTLAALKNVFESEGAATGGKGSEVDKTITVALKGMDDAPGSCPTGETSNPTDVHLLLENDVGQVILDVTSKNKVVCTSGSTSYVKFGATFRGPRDCKDAMAPTNISRGDVDVTVTTNPDSGSLSLTRSVLCKASRDR